jgi:hypothetical protein
MDGPAAGLDGVNVFSREMLCGDKKAAGHKRICRPTSPVKIEVPKRCNNQGEME